MTIKKLTVAAALAVGIASCTYSNVMAACLCEQRPIVTGPACPCTETLPVVTGGACPCEKPAPKCNPCEEVKKSDCGCPEMECKNPATALCPGSAKPAREDMKQVYAYPNAIYGSNNYVGDSTDSIYSADNSGFTVTPDGLASTTMGTTIAQDGMITGAATQMPCLNEAPSRHNGIPIMRDDRKIDNNSTPIEMSTQNSMQAIKRFKIIRVLF